MKHLTSESWQVRVREGQVKAIAKCSHHMTAELADYIEPPKQSQLSLHSMIDSDFVFYFQLQNAQNCWIAACIYLITLVAAGLQFYANRNTAEY